MDPTKTRTYAQIILFNRPSFLNPILAQQRRIKLDRHPNILVPFLTTALPCVPGVLDDADIAPHRVAVRVARSESLPCSCRRGRAGLSKSVSGLAALLGVPAVLETSHAPVPVPGDRHTWISWEMLSLWLCRLQSTLGSGGGILCQYPRILGDLILDSGDDDAEGHDENEGNKTDEKP